MKDALQIASELRRESLDLYRRASEFRATEEELLARMTPEQRKRYDEALEHFESRKGER